VKLRPALPTDTPAIAHIAADSYRIDFAEILEPAALAQRGLAFFQFYLGEKIDGITVAMANEKVLGFSLVTDRHLDMLFVARSAKSKGVGSTLLDYGEAHGITTLECFRDNRPARAFYERRGWRLARSYERDFIGRARAFVFYQKP